MKNETPGTEKAGTNTPGTDKSNPAPEQQGGQSNSNTVDLLAEFNKMSPEKQGDHLRILDADTRIKADKVMALETGNAELIKENEDLRTENERLRDDRKTMYARIQELESGAANQTIATSAKAAPITASAPSAKLEPKAGFIIAERDREQTYFANEAWELLGESKGGWSKAVPVPPEVQGSNND